MRTSNDLRLARACAMGSALAVATAVLSSAVFGASYRIPPDDLLVDKARVIVRGEVIDQSSSRSPDGGISTDITVRVDRTLKGGPLPGTIVVRQLGGVIQTESGEEGDVYPGIGTFHLHEHVLLLLTPRADRRFGVTDFALGKFHVAQLADGSEILRRDGLRGAYVVGPASATGSQTAPQAQLDPDRDAVAFERFITSRLRGANPKIDYTIPVATSGVDRSDAFTWLGEYESCVGGSKNGLDCSSDADCPGGNCPTASGGRYCVGGTNSGQNCVSNSGCPGGGHCAAFPPARRSEFDSGTKIVYKDNATGDRSVCVGGSNNSKLCASDGDCPNGYCSCPTGCHDEVASGVQKWNCAQGATVLLQYGGTDPTIGTKCSGGLVNQIQYNDPCHEIDDLSSCFGTLAVGGFSYSTASGGAPSCPAKGNPPLFQKITRGRIMINNGVGACFRSCNYTDMIAHETGHTIGAGHSMDSSALMWYAINNNQCGNLAADDAAFASCFYPRIPFRCALSATKLSGEFPLSVSFDSGTAGGSCPYTYDFDFGDGTAASTSGPTHVYTDPGTRTVDLTVTDGDGSQCTGTVTISVLPCTAPTVATVTPKVTLSGLVKAIVTGTGFLKGATVQIDSGGGFMSTAISSRTSRKRIVGKDASALWPVGVPVMVRVISATGCASNAIQATR